ncbi:MAG: phenylacetate--CoA ligase family protein [Candidatus Lokiarchaeia archaeon]
MEIIEESKYWNKTIETMPQKEIQEIQLKKLQYEINYAYHNTRYYKKSFQATGITPEDIKTLEDFKKVPMLYKDDLRADRAETGDPFGGILAVPLDERVRVINASTGTTGVPSVFAYTHNDWIQGTEQEIRIKWARGYRPGTRVYSTGFRWHGYVVLAYTGGDALGYYTIAETGYPLPNLSQKHVIALKYFKPESLAAPILTLYSLVEAAKTLGENLKEILKDLKIIDTGYGDIVTMAIKKRIEAETGVPPERIFDFGGVADPLWYFGDCPSHLGNHSCDDLFIIDIMDEETHEVLPEGERGEIVISNLFAEATPMFKWGSEDTGYVERDVCECGRTYTRVHFLGRAAFAANIKGKRVFPSELENLLGDIPGFTEYFTVLKYSKDAMDTIRMKMSVNKDKIKDMDAFVAEVKKRIKESLDADSEITIVESVSELPFVGHKTIKLLDLTKEQA